MAIFQACLLLCLMCCVESLVHNLKIVNDDRDIFKIETFGFVSGGLVNITVSDLTISNPMGVLVSTKSTTKIGFLLRKASSESAAQQDMEKIIEKGDCIFDFIQKDDFFVDLSDSSRWSSFAHGKSISTDAAGLYSLIFARCVPSGSYRVNFKLLASFKNPGPNYLSAGDAPLPTLYFSFFLLFSSALLLWLWVLWKNSGTKGNVNSIHYLMAVLLVLKCLTLLFESIRFFHISIEGLRMSLMCLRLFICNLYSLLLIH